ncbi:T9SS type A sorting domain-containing protein [Candidatus Neomarinimicrobiota bacterium]
MKRLALLSVLIVLFTNIIYSQEYTFSEIKEVILQERPQLGDILLRNKCFSSIDYNVVETYPPLNPDIYIFFRFMLEKAILEIKSEIVVEGATIWQIYNHGFVVKTPSITFGIDLNDYYETGKLIELAEIIDVLFVSHEHSDHISPEFISEMIRNNIPIIGPIEIPNIPIGMNAGDSIIIEGLSVIAHDGLHSSPVRQFEIITPEGLKILHTGDNQDTKTLPNVNDVDVLMLNAWINEGGKQLYSETIPIAIDIIKPKVTLPAHMLELGHLVGGFEGSKIYYNVVAVVDDGNLASDYHVLAWGERYHFDNNTNDTLGPNTIENLSYEVNSDSILVSWNLPLVASDGDQASFFRVIINDLEDFLITKQEYLWLWDVPGIYNIKVYAYDDCGNQSENFAEVNVSIVGNNLRINPKDNVIFIGNVSTFDIAIDNVINLGSYQFNIIYDSDIIQVNDIIIGDFLSSSGREVSVTQSNFNNSSSPGMLSLDVTSSGLNSGVNGSGILATINFTSHSVGSSTLEILNAQINDINSQSINLDSQISGFVETSPFPNWTSQSLGTDTHLNSVDAVSEIIAWTAGRNSTILRTIDGGEYWDDRWTGQEDICFWSISGIDTENAIVTGTSGEWSDGTNVTYIYRTDDGGTNWIKVFELAQGFIDDVTMFNQTDGYAIGAEIDGNFLFLKTIDGGHNWEYSPTAPLAQAGEYPLNTAINWIDKDNCWFGTSQSRLLNTTDGGNTWNVVITPLEENITVAFNKNGIGLSASNFELVRTLDSGNTWETIELPKFATILHLIKHQDNLWAMAWNTIYSSKDNGSTWEKQMSANISKTRIRYASFSSNENGTFGWAVGNYGFIAKYKDPPTYVKIANETTNPEHFSLSQNYPNPFNSTTSIIYKLPKVSKVVLTIYDIRGRKVRELINIKESAGYNSIVWDGLDDHGKLVSSGVYIYNLKAGEFSRSQKMLLLR